MNRISYCLAYDIDDFDILPLISKYSPTLGLAGSFNMVSVALLKHKNLSRRMCDINIYDRTSAT